MAKSKDIEGVKIDKRLKKKYNEYYNEEVIRGREIGAKDKAGNIMKLCSDVPHDKIIGVGAGTGAVAAALSKNGFGSKITCAEISESGIEFTKKRGIKNVNKVIKFDGYNLPFDDNEFDLTISSHVLEHVEHQRVFLKEVSRVSKYTYLEVPLLDTVRMSKNFTGNEVGHINFYNYNTFRKLLQTSGYKIVNQRIFCHSFESIQKNESERINSFVKYAIYKCAHSISGKVMSNFLVYHCGAVSRTH
ncbi:MAG: class I SAM-dependent methyltransferase [Salinibacter sp.]